MEYSDPETSSKEMGTPSWYWKAVKADPERWLSQKDIPNTPEWEKMHKIHKKIFDKVMKKKSEDMQNKRGREIAPFNEEKGEEG